MTLFHQYGQAITRRYFFKAGSHAVGWAALASLLNGDRARASRQDNHAAQGPHFPGKAKNVIYLHMVGGPPQMDLYDYKPQMQKWFDKDLPDSVRMGRSHPSKCVGRTGLWRLVQTGGRRAESLATPQEPMQLDA